MPEKSLLQNRRLGRKLLVSIILFSSLITLIASAIQLFGGYKHDIDYIDDSFANIENVHLPNLTASAWAADKADMSRQLEGIIRIPDIQYLEIKDQDIIIAQTGKPIAENSVSHSYPMYFMHKGKRQLVGTLTVQATLENALRRVLEQAQGIIISNAIKTFLVSGFLLSLFYSLVTRHLAHMAAFTQQLTLDTLNNNLILDRKKTKEDANDELDIVINGINKMRHNLLDSITAVKEERLQYQRLVESAIAIPWEIDLKTMQFSYVGPQAKVILGYPVTDWYHSDFWQRHIESSDKVDVINKYKTCVEKQEDFQIEYRMIRSDGQIIWIRDDVQIIRHDNESSQLRGYMFDITARKQAEIELNRFQMHLQQLVQERTNELEVSNKELEAFCYSVSHDLRSPLRAIDGFSQILLEDYGKDIGIEGEKYIHRVRNACQNMGILIDALLNLSRITRHSLEMKKISLSQLCSNAFDKLKMHEPERTIKIKIQPDLYVIGDEAMLAILMDNLVDNAWKYTSKTQDSSIEFGSLQKDNNTVFFIKDNGAGFDIQFAQKLFTAFHRLHKASDFEGTGIGLATVHRIVQRHNGNIWAESKINQGTTFYFTLNESVKPIDLAPIS